VETGYLSTTQTRAYFLGTNAVTFGAYIFGNAQSDFKIYYQSGKTGFSDTTAGYPSVAFYPALTHDLTYDGNGNESGSVPSGTSAKTAEYITVSDNTDSLVKTGYQFGGWNTSADGTGTSYAPGSVTFTTTHFSYYAVGYNKVSFSDVAASAWYNKAVGFIAGRGITAGTGNGNYSSEAKLTRCEFLVMMLRAYGIAPDASPKDNFTDAGSTYYTGYLAAAKRLGITEGVGNNMFAPGKEITRQEMFTLLYNTLKVIKQLPQGDSGKSLSSFSDASDIASWAKEAMALLVETGTIGGNAGKLSPGSTTTRAEMAQVIYNLFSK